MALLGHEGRHFVSMVNSPDQFYSIVGEVISVIVPSLSTGHEVSLIEIKCHD